jgi:alkylation response protein AidB-like acyl-CoA dehydrogenase
MPNEHQHDRVIDAALERIAAGAEERDAAAEPAFPASAFTELREAGLLSWNAIADTRRPPAQLELDLVRKVAAADGSVGRLYDGHLNAIERLAVQAPDDLRERELPAFGAGRLLGGVWGGDPVPGEGPPARVIAERGRVVLRGVKTFCSGAGGIDRALVLARGEDGQPPVAVWIDVADAERVEVDRGWYRGAGLRASESHRVVFHDAPVLGQFGPPGALAAQPWFARDALRTCASWVGMADAAVEGALAELAARETTSELEALAGGRILTAQRTIALWITAAANAMDTGEHLPETALSARVAVSDAVRVLLDEAARACGSRPFAHGSRLDRARRDLELFLLQHRLDPMLARAGRAALDERRS